MSSDEAALEGQVEEHQFDPNARFRVTFQPEVNSRIYLDVVWAVDVEGLGSSGDKTSSSVEYIIVSCFLKV